jgi:hypothetical protein
MLLILFSRFFSKVLEWWCYTCWISIFNMVGWRACCNSVFLSSLFSHLSTVNFQQYFHQKTEALVSFDGSFLNMKWWFWSNFFFLSLFHVNNYRLSLVSAFEPALWSWYWVAYLNYWVAVEYFKKYFFSDLFFFWRKIKNLMKLYLRKYHLSKWNPQN